MFPAGLLWGAGSPCLLANARKRYAMPNQVTETEGANQRTLSPFATGRRSERFTFLVAEKRHDKPFCFLLAEAL